MDKCSRCGAETELYENGTPLCVSCSEKIELARKKTAKATVVRREQAVKAVAS